MTNENNIDQMKRFPERFVANCSAKNYTDKVQAGEIEYSRQGVFDELAKWLDTGMFVGIGEGMPIVGPLKKGQLYHDEQEIIKGLMECMDFCRQHKIPARYHSGTPGGYAIPYHAYPSTYNPLWAHTIAVAFPDVPIIMEHAGIEGGWWEHFYEQCLHVAASHKNVYLETGRWWTELYYKALKDPNVTCEKLIWGTDWGASLPLYTNLGGYPPVYTRQVLKEGTPRHQHDIWGWSLKQIANLQISQDDMNLILGGNAVRLYNLRTPGGLTRMFKFVD